MDGFCPRGCSCSTLCRWGFLVRHPGPEVSCGPLHHHLPRDTLKGCHRTSGRMGRTSLPPETSRKRVSIDSREMRSNASMPSIEVTVASGMSSVSPCKVCAMHSHPAHSPIWLGQGREASTPDHLDHFWRHCGTCQLLTDREKQLPPSCIIQKKAQMLVRHP